MLYTVTRQRQWPEGTPVVEISDGGLDYTNPDALVAKYPGEFETYEDPREAVEVAIALCWAWRRDGECNARVAHGATGGMTMPFEPTTFKEARAWAQKQYEQLPKCARCGEVLGKEAYSNGDGEKYCREYCAEEAARNGLEA